MQHPDRVATDKSERFGWALLMVLLGLVASGAQISGGVWDGAVGSVSVGPFRWVWMVALGALIVETTSVSRKLVAISLLMAIAALAHSTNLLTSELNTFFFASVTALILFKRVSIPRILLRPVIVIASSTLFIYIVNFTVIHQMEKHGISGWLPLNVVLPMLAGIALTQVWDRVGSAIRSSWRLKRSVAAGRPVNAGGV